MALVFGVVELVVPDVLGVVDVVVVVVLVLVFVLVLVSPLLSISSSPVGSTE